MSVLNNILSKAEDVPAVQPVKPIPERSPFVPLYVVEMLGYHHGDGTFRVRMHDELYSGDSKEEALGSAMLDLLKDGQPMQIKLIA